MQNQELSASDLAHRVDWLESKLRQMQRRQRNQRIATTMVTVVVLACLTVWAQNTTGPITVRAPFRIVGSGGQTILSVTEAAPGAGKLEMRNSGGKSFTAGVDAQGGAFGRWDASNGSALIGVPPGKTDFGIRLMAAGTNTTTVALAENNQSSMVAVGRNGVAKLEMVVNTTESLMGVMDNAGKFYLSALRDHGTSAGALEIANASGQVVASMDSNPKTTEGRATFTDAGGRPLAKIGAAGDHGDVLLAGTNKGVALWEMGLTGMLH
jgi:hypothetical protein